MDHLAYVQKYPPRGPAKPPDNADETRRLTQADGVRFLSVAPAEVSSARCLVPQKKGDAGCHLWVVTAEARPFVFELEAVTPPLASGRAKHTNLTGGASASCGGELWVDPSEARHLYVNGCSGRYGPRSPEQLEDAVEVLRGVGFVVTSFGWDDEAAKPAMVLRP